MFSTPPMTRKKLDSKNKEDGEVIRSKFLLDRCDSVKCKGDIHEESIECRKCWKNLHLRCASVEKEEWKLLEKLRKVVKWICEECEEKYNQFEKENDLLKEKIKIMEKDMNLLKKAKECEDKVEIELKDETVQEEDKFEKLKKGILESVKSMNEDLKLELMRKIPRSNHVDNKENIMDEERKQNLIIYNVEECLDEDPLNRKEDDLKTVMEIFEKGTKVYRQDYDIKRVIRLGKRYDENGQVKKRRPILVRLGSVQEKWKIIKRANYLSNAPDGLHKVSIVLDLNEKQREENKKLIEELKSRRERGEDVVIRRGEIYPRTNFV